MARFMPPLIALRIMLFIICLVLIWGIDCLRRAFGGPWLATYIAVALLLLHNPWSLGGSASIIRDPTPGPFAIGICLFGLASFLRGFYVRAFAIIGLAANVHASYAIFTAALCAPYLTWRIREIGWHTLLKAVAASLAAASPLFLLISLSPGLPGDVPSFSDWFSVVSVRSAGHVLPLSWPLATYLRFVPTLFLLPLVCAGVKKKEVRLKLYSVVIGFGLLCLGGFVFTELLPVRQVIQLTAFRSSHFIMLIGVVGSTVVLLPRMQRNRLLLAIVLSFWTSYFIGVPALALALLAGTFLAVFQRGNQIVRYTLGGVAAGMAIFTGTSVGMPNSDVLIPLAAMLTVFVPISLIRHRSRHIVLPILGLFFLVTLGVMGFYESYSDQTRAYRYAKQDIEYWLQYNTSVDSLAIVPPNSRTWSGFSQRGVFFTYFDLGLIIYSPPLLPEGMRRATEFVPDFKASLAGITGRDLRNALESGFNNWTTSDYQRISREYNCSVAVVEKPMRLPFELAYENAFFSVYWIPPGI